MLAVPCYLGQGSLLNTEKADNSQSPPLGPAVDEGLPSPTPVEARPREIGRCGRECSVLEVCMHPLAWCGAFGLSFTQHRPCMKKNPIIAVSGVWLHATNVSEEYMLNFCITAEVSPHLTKHLNCCKWLWCSSFRIPQGFQKGFLPFRLVHCTHLIFSLQAPLCNIFFSKSCQILGPTCATSSIVIPSLPNFCLHSVS